MINIEVNGKSYQVTLAKTEEEKEKGLQNVESLGENEGMLFCYEEPEHVGFWMKDTLIPLDIIFIDEYGEVISVAQGEPGNETPMEEDNVSYVLEVNPNSGIAIGDDVDLSELDEEEDEGINEGISEGETPKMHVLAENGETQMELDGGERIFSRIHTRKLISLSKKAQKSKKDTDYKKLGKKVFEFIDKQNTQKQEFTQV